MKKLLLLASVVVLICLAGCGGNETPKTIETNTTDEIKIPENGTSDYCEHHLTNAAHEIKLDIDNKYIMVKEGTEVRGTPEDDAKVNRTVSCQLVNVYAVVYGDREMQENDDRWVLIGFRISSENYDNMGWVKESDLMEYGEDNYQLLNYPVSVKEGTTDLDTGETVTWTRLFVRIRDGYAEITNTGGRFHKVALDSIVYPPFEKSDE